MADCIINVHFGAWILVTLLIRQTNFHDHYRNNGGNNTSPSCKRCGCVAWVGCPCFTAFTCHCLDAFGALIVVVLVEQEQLVFCGKPIPKMKNTHHFINYGSLMKRQYSSVLLLLLTLNIFIKLLVSNELIHLYICINSIWCCTCP